MQLAKAAPHKKQSTSRNGTESNMTAVDHAITELSHVDVACFLASND
jgi:hypothetical protein